MKTEIKFSVQTKYRGAGSAWWTVLEPTSDERLARKIVRENREAKRSTRLLKHTIEEV